MDMIVNFAVEKEEFEYNGKTLPSFQFLADGKVFASTKDIILCDYRRKEIFRIEIEDTCPLENIRIDRGNAGSDSFGDFEIHLRMDNDYDITLVDTCIELSRWYIIASKLLYWVDNNQLTLREVADVISKEVREFEDTRVLSEDEQDSRRYVASRMIAEQIKCESKTLEDVYDTLKRDDVFFRITTYPNFVIFTAYYVTIKRGGNVYGRVCTRKIENGKFENIPIRDHDIPLRFYNGELHKYYMPGFGINELMEMIQRKAED